MAETVIGVIGGSGIYGLEGFPATETIDVSTPYGPTSSQVAVVEREGVRLLFISRHGAGHTLLPGEINARANIWALKKLGAAWCIAITACGSLAEDLRPGDLVLPDQLIDRTNGRPSTFFGSGLAMHVAFGDPFCPVLRTALAKCARAALAGTERALHDTGTLVVIEGPSFSTRAESQMHRAFGATLVGMTVLPEAKLAREAELSYAALALVSDYDCWRDKSDVSVPEILRTLQESAKYAQQTVLASAELLVNLAQPEEIRDALACALHTRRELVPPEVLEELDPIIGRYFQ